MIWPEKLRNQTPYIPGPVCPVRLDANESFLTPPPELWDRVQKALAATAPNRYPDPLALETCRLAAELYGVELEQVVAGNGSDELISLILGALLPHGGKILLNDPDFSMYRFYAGLYELQCVSIEDFADPPAGDLLILSNPCNPTGQGLDRKTVENLLVKSNTFTVIDEAYMDFWDQSVMHLIGKIKNLVVLKTCSKSFGMAGFRLGFALCHKEVADMLRIVKSPFNVNAFTQSAATVFLSEPEYLRSCAESIKASKDSLYALLSDWSRLKPGYTVTATYTNFVLLHCPDAPVLHKSLLAQGVAVRLLPSNLLRITAGSPDDHKMLLTALNDAHSEREGRS